MPNKSHWRNKSLDFFKDPQAPIILRLQAYLEIKKFSGSWLNITAKDLGITELDLNIELLKEARLKRFGSLFLVKKQHSLGRCSCNKKIARSLCRSKLWLKKYYGKTETIITKNFQETSIH